MCLTAAQGDTAEVVIEPKTPMLIVKRLDGQKKPHAFDPEQLLRDVSTASLLTMHCLRLSSSLRRRWATNAA
jgi:hypothetical protein